MVSGTHFVRRLALMSLALSAIALSTANAQAQSGVTPAVNAAISRARILSDNGEESKSRALLDSLVSAVPRESNDLSEVLYWRAQLSEDQSSSERDWKRLIVDVPFSPRASEALLKLSELDLQRSNPTLARQHVQQLLADYPESSQRPRALLVLARSYFDQRDTPRGCGIVSAVRRDAPLSAVELRLQADELQQQCRGVTEVAMGRDPDFAAPVPVSAAGSLAAQTAALPPARGTGAGSATKPDTVKQAPPRLSPAAAKALADSIRRDSVARATASRAAQKVTADSVRKDSIARATATRTAARATADSVRRDSVARVVAQRLADSVRRDSVTRAGLQRAAAQRIADNARRDSIARRDSASRETLRRDSIALDSMGRNRTAPPPGRNTTNPPVVTTRGGSQTRDVLLVNADSARGDSLAREAAAVEARILGNVAIRDSLKRVYDAAAAAKRAAARAGKWTVQIAAYQTKSDAEALVKRLSARNIEARIAGTKKPWRVQVGRFATRAEAAEELVTLKKNGQKTGFVAEIGK